MDNQLLHPKSSVLDYKLTKSASFSELSSKKKIVIEKQYQIQTHGNLFKQYSCEEIFDKTSNTSQIKVSHIYKTDDAEHVNTWEKTVPAYNFLRKPIWFNNENKQTNFQTPFSNQALTEMNNVNSKATILPTKLVIDESQVSQLSIKEQSSFGDVICKKNENPKTSPNYLFKKPKLFTLQNDENFHEDNDKLKRTPELISTEKRKNEHENNGKFKRETPELTSTENKLTMSEENRRHKLDTSQLKKRLRSLVAVEPKKKSSAYLCWSFMFFLLLPAAIIFLALVLNNINTSDGFCTPRFNLKTITQDLRKHVYDQDIAIGELAKFFNEKDNQTSFEVIAFIGGIGVGKSYTADIIRNKIKSTGATLDVFPPLYDKENQVYGALSVCRCNFIRFENLKTDDIVDAASFISNLKKRAEKYCILVMALFNTEEVDHNLKRSIDYDRSISLIKDKFGEVNLQPNIISFTSLSNEALVKCVKDAGDYNNLKLSDEDIEYVMRDLVTGESGCKGAYAKVQLVGKS